MLNNQYSWKALAIIALSLSLAWGLRGQHGHERGAALAGAMVALSLAAVTGGPRWIGAAVIGSLGFAIGGSLSYGRFIQPAFEGSLQAIVGLGLVGFAWGGVGALGMALGLALANYRTWERLVIGIILLGVWILVDQLLWVRVSGPDDLETRQLMAALLLSCWVLLCGYIGIWRQDRTALKLALAGGIGLGIGFPLAAWIQGVGQLTGIPIDWWKVAEHAIGLCGGLSLGWAALSLAHRWGLPLAVRPLERWIAFVWLLWLIPTWLIANNLDYWIVERALLPVVLGDVIWAALFFMLFLLILWGFLGIRQGKRFVTSWMPNHLRKIFLSFVWITTVIASSKSLAIGDVSPTPVVFLVMALLITWLVQSSQVKTPGA